MKLAAEKLLLNINLNPLMSDKDKNLQMWVTFTIMLFLFLSHCFVILSSGWFYKCIQNVINSYVGYFY